MMSSDNMNMHRGCNLRILWTFEAPRRATSKDSHSSQQLRGDPYSSKALKEVKSLMRKSIPVAEQVLGESHDVTLRMKLELRHRSTDTNATLGDPALAVTMLEETEIARRVRWRLKPACRWRLSRLRESRERRLRAREGTAPGNARQ